jgi:hypothetical protein
VVPLFPSFVRLLETLKLGVVGVGKDGCRPRHAGKCGDLAEELAGVNHAYGGLAEEAHLEYLYLPLCHQ